MIFDSAQLAAPVIAAQLANAQRILLLTHINPDGDAIGSLLGVWHVLSSLGKQVLPLASSPLPGYALWLPGAEHIRIYEPGLPFPDVDLVMLVDTASLERIGQLYNEHTLALVSQTLIIIDHHVTNAGAGTINLIDSRAASTCELLYQLFTAMELPVPPDTATCLLLGLTTDTQSFRTSSTNPTSLRVAADLLNNGANHSQVVNQVYFSLPASSMLLIGLALAELRLGGPIAWTTITQAMMQTSGASDDATDEVIQMMQRIGEIRALVVFKERVDGTTKISLRSRPPIDVASLAQIWGGGGHAQAAGAVLLMPPIQAENEVLPRLRELCTVS